MNFYAMIFVVLFGAVLVWGVVIYNGLVEAINRIRVTFSQMDVQLQRRHDLIPNLVDTAKAYMKHERETLEAVINARNQAAQAAREIKDVLSLGTMQTLLGAENALGGLLSRFFALSEAYPDLKANQNMKALMEELATAENRVAFARQAYNDAVMYYNIRREIFPNSLIASSVGFQ
ncbi:MAG: LemA family protein, partial [Zoogloeaceae bacterium]|nr:LemA family protein [Zoogloeaceae bacterium]